MGSPHDNSGHRRILVGTTQGRIEGDLAVGQQVRTLDYLNRGSMRFVPLKAVRPLSFGPALQCDTVHVNMATILWVAEIDGMRRAGPGAAKPQLNRSAVRFCLPECEVLGFLHTPVQGDPLARLSQERSPFFAVTSASIIGSDAAMAAAFLAVNSQRVFTAELIADDVVVEEGASAFEETRS